jgi:hypothetical protein
MFDKTRMHTTAISRAMSPIGSPLPEVSSQSEYQTSFDTGTISKPSNIASSYANTPMKFRQNDNANIKNSKGSKFILKMP